jgi:hypothetical protein
VNRILKAQEAKDAGDEELLESRGPSEAAEAPSEARRVFSVFVCCESARQLHHSPLTTNLNLKPARQ